jgi:acyl-CoA synthetase (AMP-forming)/AMP-acid ligase II
MNIAEILRARAQSAGERPAIIDRHGEISFRDLDRLSARFAARFERDGLRTGDRVLVAHPVSIPLYALLIALFRLGAIALFLDPHANRAQWDRCCRIAAPRGFIGSRYAQLLRLLVPSIRRIPIKIVVSAGASAGSDTSRQRDRIEPCADDTPALLTFTSGSTGEPKAALRTHGFLLAQNRVLEKTLQRTPEDIDLTALPMFVLSNLAAGVTSLIPDADFRRPGAINALPVLRQIQQHRPTSLIAAPAFLDRLVSHARERELDFERGATLDSLRHIFTGGAPVFPNLLRKVRAAAPRAAIIAVYGSTEAEPIAHVDLADITSDDFEQMKNGAGLLAGRPIEDIDLRIIEDCWGTPLISVDERVPDGQIGEIVVSGDHVLTGYLNGVGDAETKIRTHTAAGDRVWHRTGDAGYLDATGRLWLMGRCSAHITDAQGTLYPFAVETAALEIVGIARAALVQRRGRRVLAVELEPDASRTPRDLRASLLDALRWANLADIIFVRAIPVDRRHNAKVDYPRLAQLIEKHKHGRV